MASDFAGHSERFYVRAVDERESADVCLDLSIGGLSVLQRDGRLTKRKIPLDHITRWTRSSDRVTIFVKTPVDIEEKAISYYGAGSVLSSFVDTLTGFCLQLVEIMEAQHNQERANEMRAVARNGGRRHKQLKNADEVEFWRKPEKEGWLQSQGEVIKTWRKRWFVLKDGFLFRFLDNKVSASSKPRGIIDLSKVGEICDGQGATNRPNSIKVGREKGFVVYLADSETDQVEWLSALEVTVARLVKIIAGVEDEPAAARGGDNGGSRGAAAMLQQAERDFAAARPSGPPRSSSRSGGGGGGGGYSSGDFGGFSGSSRYPGVEAPRMAAGGDRGVYRDELGVQYGLGSGTTIGGIAGVGGVRHVGGGFGGGAGGGGNSGFSGASSYSGYSPSLPATVNVSDGGYPQHDALPPHGMHGGAPQYGQQGGRPDSRHQWAPTLPDTLDVVSIIDQPPAQTSSYGIGNAAQGMPQHAPWGAQAPPQQWQMHHTPEGRPYYFDPATGQSTWDPPH